MGKYIIHILYGEFRQGKILLTNADTEAEARSNAMSLQSSLSTKICSVTPIEKLTLLEVPERHPRTNWKCFKFKEWPYYKADLDVTNPENSIMVSCFEPTEFRPEDRDLFENLILKSVQNL